MLSKIFLAGWKAQTYNSRVPRGKFLTFMTFILFITFQDLFLAYVPLTHVPRIFKFQEKHALGKWFCEFSIYWKKLWLGILPKTAKNALINGQNQKLQMLLDGKAHALLANLLKALGSTYFDWPTVQCTLLKDDVQSNAMQIAPELLGSWWGAPL